ncbi:type I-G CRISPR-associated helicase/endonuclease Cas3g [Nocardia macrotermitis]|uniref:HD Cas3-type domain-containing protein n=1 Tax=Nocardia macrotermitis TaxID=2585198 RepID=A0A7K0DFW1_9NOCA|nr:type I-U CRISPR-associated helicase/endonuclease Cas3 [Nocardia macrotermitis]MQY24421.1 hypothetical protein [Nocardia macrotermitis]
MSLDLNDFGEFFARTHGDDAPFRWQTRLAERLCTTGRWPERIDAPTGSGKSSVVDIHLFANALHAVGAGARVPRRLSVVVNRRGLVDQHAVRAQKLAELLNPAADDAILAEVAAALRSLRTGQGSDEDTESFVLAMLRGGVPADRRWVDDPSRCVILCATPDMWGSRLLMRGYGSSRYARPREAGLLAYDSAVVIDEAHLNRQLLLTAQRVGELAARTAVRLGVAALQTVETTATPAGSGTDPAAEGVNSDEVETEPVLARRLLTAKPVHWTGMDSWTGRAPSARYLEDLAVLIRDQHKRFGRGIPTGRTVGCVVNRVDTAVKLAALLEKQGLRVEARVGRMRPYDLERMLAEKPGLLTAAGDATTDVLVATQTVEVGVDIDLAAMVTELAPGSALAQRAGRVNRVGESTETEVLVVGPHDPEKVVDTPPYVKDDLTAAYDWVLRRENDPKGLAPLAISHDPAPTAQSRRTLLQRLELSDAHLLSRTNDPLCDQPDLGLWLRDDLDPDQAMAAVVVRAHLPEDDSIALELLRAVPPTDVEAFPCRLGEASGLITRVQLAEDRSRVFLWRGDRFVDDPEIQVRPGDVIVLDDCHPVQVKGVVVTDTSSRPAKPVPIDRLPGIREIILTGDMLDEFADMTAEDAQRDYEDAGGIGQLVPGPLEPTSIDPRLSWIVIRDAKSGTVDEETRQEWTPNKHVFLDAHSEAVANRAFMVGQRVGLAEPLCEVVRHAGLDHDLGKKIDWFQRLLGRGSDDPPLAKSRKRSEYQAKRTRATCGMPTGWRHEQQSVIDAAHALDDGGVTDAWFRDLILRLVGTSHGRGRPGFPHSAAELSSGTTDPRAVTLFDTGRWDTLIERTHIEWGIWGACYLEALLRAADGQCSQEGT